MQRPRRQQLFGGNQREGGGFFSGLFRLAFVMVVGFGVYHWLFASRVTQPDAKAPSQAQAANSPSSPAGVPQDTKAVELTTTASIQRQQLSVAKFNQRQAIGLYNEVTKAFDEWEKELLAWEKEGPALFKNEDGKRIATDGTEVKRFRGLNQPDRPTTGELGTARKAAEDLISTVRESLNNPDDASTPADGITSTLRNLQTDARRARESYRQARDAVRAMLVKVKDNPPGEQTLEEAVATLDQADAAARVAEIDAAEKNAKDEGAKRIAEEKARLAKDIADGETTRIQNEAAKKRQETELATAKSVEEMAKRQKEAELELAHIRDLAEQKRQGDLKSGSVWKGSLLSSGGTTFEGKMTIESRVNDDVKGSLVYQTTGGGERGQFTFMGKVTGTSLKLTPVTGGPETDVHKCVYNPASKTISGGGAYRSFNLKLSDGKDE